MPLVVVESPAKCSKIKGFLGSRYDVVASFGHIRALVPALDSVGIDRDFDPIFEFQKEKSKAINQIKDAAKKHNQVILAADDDREGEAIAYSVCLLLKLDPSTTPRAVFHEITKPAVTNAIANPRTLDMNKVHAQQSRAVLDMLVGFTMSPLLWSHVAPGLSAGRCQTPALRLVADKEQEITNFKSSLSWKVHGQWSHSTMTYDAALTDDLQDEESATNYLEMRVGQQNGTVLDAKTRPTQEQPPKPLITSTLQQQASSFLRANPKETMQIAQRLYEAGHITYMRTDKAVLSEEAKKEGADYILSTFGKAYLGSGSPTAKKTKAKQQESTEVPKAQEAHEAIRPTHMNLTELPSTEDWSNRDHKIYKLIWTRAMQSLMAPCQGESRSIDFRAEGDDEDWTWRVNLSRTTFDGWRKLDWKEIQEEVEQSKAEQWQASEALKKGSNLAWQTLQAEPHFTKAPSRYTEATLIKELEENGIGRPSTFASLISTILEKNYVEKKSFDAKEVAINQLTLTPSDTEPSCTPTKKKLGGEKDRLVPTPLGQSVLTYLLAKFPNLFAYKFTAEMEKRLDSVAEGTEPWKQVVKDTWNSYKDLYTAQKRERVSVTEGSSDRRKELGEGIIAIVTKKGPLLLKEGATKEDSVFYGWPAKADFQSMTLQAAKAFIEVHGKEKTGDLLGNLDGSDVIKKKGPYGWYVEWNGKKVSCEESSTLETIETKLRSAGSATLKAVGQFEIRNGPYGMYMFKPAAAKKQFVSVPASVKIDELTEVACIAIFQNGLQQKAKSKAYGRGGGRGGRGGGRGGRGRGS